MTVFSFLGPVLLLLATAVHGIAGSLLILKTDPDKFATVLARYQLTDVRFLEWEHGTVSHVVAPQSGVTPAQVVAVTVGDADVMGIEVDADLDIGESKVRVALPASPLSLPACASDRTAVKYYQSAVRSGYVVQPSNDLIHLKGAQDKGITGTGIVAIIDTGVDPLHPALAPVLVPGYDFTRDVPGYASDWPDIPVEAAWGLAQSTVAILDTKGVLALLSQSTVAILDQSTVAILDQIKKYGAFGHGTMVAGLVHLVAPTARIMPLKAFHADGSAKLSNIARAIRYAADHGASIVNLSFSLNAASQELSDAILYAQSKKVIVIASAGNAGSEKSVYPAAYRGVIGVGSVNLADKRSYFSNYGGSTKTSAPGEALLTTFPGNNYAGVWGTSFSAALVSGAVALMKQVKPGIDAGKVADALDKGQIIHQDMGDARLDLTRSLTYFY